MNNYQKLRFEYSNNQEDLNLIDHLADKAIDVAVGYSEYAIRNTTLTDAGLLHIDLVEGQDCDEQMLQHELQGYFDDAFHGFIQESHLA